MFYDSKKKEIEEVKQCILELEKIKEIVDNSHLQRMKEIMFQGKQFTNSRSHFFVSKVIKKEKRWALMSSEHGGKYYFVLYLETGEKVFCFKSKFLDYYAEEDSSENYDEMAENSNILSTVYEFECKKESKTGFCALKIKVVNR